MNKRVVFIFILAIMQGKIFEKNIVDFKKFEQLKINQDALTHHAILWFATMAQKRRKEKIKFSKTLKSESETSEKKEIRNAL